jgi:hypothetical protein
VQPGGRVEVEVSADGERLELSAQPPSTRAAGA